MSKEAMKLAFEALKGYRRELNDHQPCDAEKALEEALAKQEQCMDCGSNNIGTPATYDSVVDSVKAKQEQGEPVAFESLLGAIARGWCHEKNANKEMDSDLLMAIATEVKALYITPQQRTWVGLNDTDLAVCNDEDEVDIARYWEAKLKEKNT
jgi:hypothetical protein